MFLAVYVLQVITLWTTRAHHVLQTFTNLLLATIHVPNASQIL